MSNSFFSLLHLEFRNQTKINNLAKYIFLFIAFCTLSITFISNHEDLREFGILFSIICIPLAQLNIAHALLKNDISDGTLESLLTIFSPNQITIAKFVCLTSCTCLAFLINIPIISILYNLNTKLLGVILLSGFFLAICSSAISCLVSSIQCYFRSNTNFLSILIMPIIIPNIIVTGLALQNSNNSSYLMILLGISLIISPIAIFLSKHLIKNLYNA